MTQEELNKVLELHRKWLNHEPGGERADLRGANLSWTDLNKTNLRWADLRGANLDYSCWPLWCGSKGVKVDKRIAAQLAYHFCWLDCDDPDYIKARNAVLFLANQFHRVEECGGLEPVPAPEKEATTP